MAVPKELPDLTTEEKAILSGIREKCFLEMGILIPMDADPGSEFSVSCGHTRVHYCGVDSKIKQRYARLIVRQSGESGLIFGWPEPGHFFQVIKFGLFPDEAGRWAEWNIYTNVETVVKFPRSPTARLYWQAALHMGAAVAVGVGKIIQYDIPSRN